MFLKEVLFIFSVKVVFNNQIPLGKRCSSLASGGPLRHSEL